MQTPDSRLQTPDNKFLYGLNQEQKLIVGLLGENHKERELAIEYFRNPDQFEPTDLAKKIFLAKKNNCHWSKINLNSITSDNSSAISGPKLILMYRKAGHHTTKPYFAGRLVGKIDAEELETTPFIAFLISDYIKRRGGDELREVIDKTSGRVIEESKENS